MSKAAARGRATAFVRSPKDFYETTDPKPVARLLRFVSPGSSYMEPCAGAGALVRQLDRAGLVCTGASDIAPRSADILQADALALSPGFHGIPRIITNPPWSRDLLHPLIDHFLELAAESWLLFDADWLHTQYAPRYRHHISDIVSVGKVKWFAGTRDRGFDCCAWYRFAKDSARDGVARFHYRPD